MTLKQIQPNSEAPLQDKFEYSNSESIIRRHTYRFCINSPVENHCSKTKTCVLVCRNFFYPFDVIHAQSLVEILNYESVHFHIQFRFQKNAFLTPRKI